MLKVAVEEGAARARVTIDRPERLNALPAAIWPELRRTLDRLAADERVRAVVLHGAGRCFSVGGDVHDMGELGDAGARRRYLADAVGAVRHLEEFPKPTVAAVHGNCLGGGLELTLVCDLVVCDETARFGVPESRVGLVPGVLLAKAAGTMNPHWLKYMAMTGEPLDAEQARLAGLVNLVVPEGGHLERAEQLAGELARRAPLSLEIVKAAVNRGSFSYDEAVAHGALLQGSEDFAEGAAAFRERREPRFRGR